MGFTSGMRPMSPPCYLTSRVIVYLSPLAPALECKSRASKRLSSCPMRDWNAKSSGATNRRDSDGKLGSL